MKRITLIVISLIMILMITGCGAKTAGAVETAQPAAQTAPATEQSAELQTAEAEFLSAPSVIPEDQQKQLIMTNYSLWAYTEPWDSPWFYAVTDLDHNGRMEIIAATLQGTGLYTWMKVYEVNADCSGLSEVALMEEEGFSYPDLVVDSMPCYYDAEVGLYYYSCEDIIRDGAARYYDQNMFFFLCNGKLDFQTIATKETVYTEDKETVTCLDKDGNVISEADCETYADWYFAGKLKSELMLSWTQVENPWPEEDAAGNPDIPAGPQIVITKNPTSETIAIGGKTWFIAHADNAASLTWQMTGPDGVIYYSLDSAMAIHPGLKLEALDGDTLAVSNVPLSANGWGVVALFENGNSSAVTEPAYLYVGDFLTAYSSVIDAYKTAYAQGEGRFEYAMQHDLSEIVRYSTGVGYALKDLDKNGIPELIIEGIGTDDFSKGIAYGIYTLVNDQPVNLATSWARNRYYICTDSTILNEGSGGAGHSVITVFRLSGQTLNPVENLMTYFDGNERDGYYRQTGSLSWEPQPGDQKIDGNAFSTAVEQAESKIYTPLLTKIA